MLKIFRNNKDKSTIAVIENCGTDAITRIGRVMAARHKVSFKKFKCKTCAQLDFALKAVPNADVARMNDTIKATVTCDERDTYNEAVGESEAVKKAMANHKNSYLRALKRWQVAMLKDVMAVSPETFEEAVHTVCPCKCKKND